MKVYIINSITKSYILNIKIRPLVTEYALMIKLVGGTSSTHSFNPYANLCHSWSYFDIQNLLLVIIYFLCSYCRLCFDIRSLEYDAHVTYFELWLNVRDTDLCYLTIFRYLMKFIPETGRAH